MKLLFDKLRAKVLETSEPILIEAASDLFSQSVVFVNEDAIDRVIEGEIDLDQLPSFAPPYPVIFIESEVPNAEQHEKEARKTYGFKHRGVIITRRVGIFVNAYEYGSDKNPDGAADYPLMDNRENIIEPENPRWLLNFSLYAHDGGTGIMPFAKAAAYLDHEGKAIPITTHGRTEYGYCYTEIRKEFARNVVEFLSMSLTPESPKLDWKEAWFALAKWSVDAAMYTIGMLHISNIGSQSFEPSRAESHKFERKYGVPMSRYHMLKITGKGRDAGTLLGASTGRRNPLHSVRGHFATYTDEAPLFGHFVGTVYIHQHLRGDIKRGTVTKDYKVEVKPESK